MEYRRIVEETEVCPGYHCGFRPRGGRGVGLETSVETRDSLPLIYVSEVPNLKRT